MFILIGETNKKDTEGKWPKGDKILYKDKDNNKADTNGKDPSERPQMNRKDKAISREGLKEMRGEREKGATTGTLNKNKTPSNELYDAFYKVAGETNNEEKHDNEAEHTPLKIASQKTELPEKKVVIKDRNNEIVSLKNETGKKQKTDRRSQKKSNRE